MKTTAALTLAGALLALPVLAQNQGAPGLPGGAPGGIRILPAPAPPPVPDIDVAPGFPGEDVPDEAWIEPGMHMMPDMPGRYSLLSAQVNQNGKPTPVVLRIDTMTGQVWQLKTVTRQVRHNGKIQAETSLGFVMVNEPGNLAPGRQHHHGGAGAAGGGGAPAPGGLPGLGLPETDPAAPNATETAPARPEPRPFPRNRRPVRPRPAPQPEGANTAPGIPARPIRALPAVRPPVPPK